MITNVQIFTTQLTVSISARSRLSLVFYSLLLWTQLQMASRNFCIPFLYALRLSWGYRLLASQNDFFSSAAAGLQSTSFKLVPKLGAVGNQAVIKWLAYWILCVNQRVPFDTGCRSIPYLHSTKSIRCGPDGPRICLLGVPSRVGTSVHPTKRSRITRSRDIPRYKCTWSAGRLRSWR